MLFPGKAPLQEDRDVLEILVDRHDSVAAQRLYPDLAVIANGKFRGTLTLSSVYEAMWSNVNFLEAWLKSGRSYYPHCFPGTNKNNHEVGLMLAKYSSPSAFKLGTSFELRRSKHFMQQAVAVQSELYLCLAERNLLYDQDLAILALSGQDSQNWLSRFIADNPAFSSFFQNLSTFLNQRLADRDAFVKGFLPMIAVTADQQQQQQQQQPVTILQCDTYTTTDIKKLIASFIGIPTGQEPQRLRRAQESVDTSEDISCRGRFGPWLALECRDSKGHLLKK